MRKTILTILGSALIASSMAQVASAAEHHRGRTSDRMSVQSTERLRNSNAYYAPAPAYVPAPISGFDSNFSGAGR